MRRLLVFLAACGSDATPTPPLPEPIVPPKPLEPIRGAHGGVINVLAVTADGRAAVSGDVTGGLRLWPTLDGTREPIVVKAPVAVSLAIAYDGSGFAIAVTDAANRVELVCIDTRGAVRSRRQLGEAVQVEAVGDSFLVLRADQVIDHVAVDGTAIGRLPADAGTQIESLAVRDRTMLAIVSTDKHRYARAISLPLAWGKQSAPLALADDASIVLVPEGTAVIARDAKEDRIGRFELATGVHTPLCPNSTATFRLRRHRFDDFGGGISAAFEEPIAVIDGRVACVVDRIFTWWDLAKSSSTTAPLGSATGQLMFAAANDRVVIAQDHQLAIHTPERADYLGYGFRDLTHVRSVPGGLMIGKGDQQPVLLDESFRERARFALPKLRVDWTDLIPIDDRYIITSSTRPGGGDMWGNAYQVAVYDSVKQVMHQVLPHRARSGDLAYEASTRMLVASDGTKSLLMQVDLEQHTIGNEVTLELENPPRQIALVDPKLAGGLVAIAVRDEGGGALTVFEFHGSDMPPQQEAGDKLVERALRPRRVYQVGGELRAIDRAGRIYVAREDVVDVRAAGTSIATLSGVAGARLRPSPDGKHVVTVENGIVTLFQATGRKIWRTAAWGSSDLDWTATGMLYARFPHALARIDVATGRLAERQCGWAFGIAQTPRETSTAAPSVCDAGP